MAIGGNEDKSSTVLMRVVVAIAIVTLGALLAGIVSILPTTILSNDLGDGIQELKPDQLAKAKNDIRTTLLQALAGVFLAIGAIATLRQLRFTRIQLRLAQEQATQNQDHNREQLRLTQEQATENQRHNREQLVLTGKQIAQTEESRQEELRLNRQGQITERFTRAVDQLGSKELDVRLGGIYALERIARDSPPDRHTIAEVLAAYIRQHSPWPPSLPGQYTAEATFSLLPDLEIRANDIQTAINVLGQRMFADSSDIRKLVHADLRRANFTELDFTHAFFSNCNLNWTHWAHAKLDNAIFMFSDLRNAYMFEATLTGSSFTSIDLGTTSLGNANLEGAEFFGVNFEEAEDIRTASLRNATADSRSRWPEGFDPTNAGVRIQ